MADSAIEVDFQAVGGGDEQRRGERLSQSPTEGARAGVETAVGLQQGFKPLE